MEPREIKYSDLSSYDYLNHEHLIIHKSKKESFLITLYLSCVELDSAEDIKIHQTDSGSLVIKKDAVSNIKYPKQRCLIRSVHQLNAQQVEKAKQLAIESQLRWPDIERWDGKRLIKIKKSR